MNPSCCGIFWERCAAAMCRMDKEVNPMNVGNILIGAGMILSELLDDGEDG